MNKPRIEPKGDYLSLTDVFDAMVGSGLSRHYEIGADHLPQLLGIFSMARSDWTVGNGCIEWHGLEIAVVAE